MSIHSTHSCCNSILRTYADSLFYIMTHEVEKSQLLFLSNTTTLTEEGMTELIQFAIQPYPTCVVYDTRGSLVPSTGLFQEFAFRLTPKQATSLSSTTLLKIAWTRIDHEQYHTKLLRRLYLREAIRRLDNVDYSFEEYHMTERLVRVKLSNGFDVLWYTPIPSLAATAPSSFISTSHSSSSSMLTSEHSFSDSSSNSSSTLPPTLTAGYTFVTVLDCFTCTRCKTQTLSTKGHPRCTGCAHVFYCSTKCQKRDWKNHKNHCTKIHLKK